MACPSLGPTGTMSQINPIPLGLLVFSLDTVSAGSMGYIGLIVLAVTIGLYAFLAKVNSVG
ncbi:hypothetical protein OK016_02850 [Vibrio chagasii]|nr:hypothetical protein [Vibrio chagasii]